MSGTLVCLIDSIQARQTCPACDGPRLPHNLPTQWHETRAIFSCGAVFIARGEAIEVERPCGDRSALCAQLWTISAKGQGEGKGRVVCISPAHDQSGEITRLILALADSATEAGFDYLTICEIIRDEMALAAKAGVTP